MAKKLKKKDKKNLKKLTTKKGSKDLIKKGAKKLLGIKSKGPSKTKSAKQLLKKAYERKAKQQIRFGLLGTARKTLRKKATVI